MTKKEGQKIRGKSKIIQNFGSVQVPAIQRYPGTRLPNFDALYLHMLFIAMSFRAWIR